jgi:hypothetical protein
MARASPAGVGSTKVGAFSEYWETPGGRVRYTRRLEMIRRTLSEQVRDVLLIGCGYGNAPIARCHRLSTRWREVHDGEPRIDELT